MASCGFAPRFQQGEWEYVIDNLAPSHSSIVVQVMSSPSSSEDTVRTEVWTSADATGTLNATAAPLIVYASVSDAVHDSSRTRRPRSIKPARSRKTAGRFDKSARG